QTAVGQLGRHPKTTVRATSAPGRGSAGAQQAARETLSAPPPPQSSGIRVQCGAMSLRRRIVSVVGTRPNIMKIAPVAAQLDERNGFEHVLVHTGQHYDDSMFRIFFEQLKVAGPHHVLDVGSATHGVQTARVMERLEPVLTELSPDAVLVPGDVNSTMG